MAESCSTLVIGGGITGLTIARELTRRGDDRVLVLEKEARAGLHASGRNSGVLHAGIYYTPDSRKARTTVEGNRLMKEFCRRHRLPLHETGKVVVAREEPEVPRLDELIRRAEAAGARARLIDPEELATLEPHARTVERALHTPDTAVVDPLAILEALEAELEASGRARVRHRVAFRGPAGERQARTSAGVVRFDRLVNAAGAYADRVAHGYGAGGEYRILPFKGTYRRLVDERSSLVRGNIYPVPDLRNPFLGIHFTRSVGGEVHAGPTALPAFGREAYGWLRGGVREAPLIAARGVALLAANASFRTIAAAEPRKVSDRAFYREARRLVPDLRPRDLLRSPKVGIRAQLVHWPTRQLVDDFLLARAGDTLHVLNAISPAFTCSMAFARHAVDLILERKDPAWT